MTANNRIKTAVALAATLGVLAPAAASARVAHDPTADGRGAVAASTPLVPDPATGGYGSSSLPSVQAVHVAGNGAFDWGDAGIGAAGGVGLSALAFGGALALTGRRERRPRRSVAAAS